MTGCERSVSLRLDGDGDEDHGEEEAFTSLKAKGRSCLRAGLLSHPVLSPCEGEVIGYFTKKLHEEK